MTTTTLQYQHGTSCVSLQIGKQNFLAELDNNSNSTVIEVYGRVATERLISNPTFDSIRSLDVLVFGGIGGIIMTHQMLLVSDPSSPTSSVYGCHVKVPIGINSRIWSVADLIMFNGNTVTILIDKGTASQPQKFFYGHQDYNNSFEFNFDLIVDHTSSPSNSSRKGLALYKSSDFEIHIPRSGDLIQHSHEYAFTVKFSSEINTSTLGRQISNEYAVMIRKSEPRPHFHGKFNGLISACQEGAWFRVSESIFTFVILVLFVINTCWLYQRLMTITAPQSEEVGMMRLNWDGAWTVVCLVLVLAMPIIHLAVCHLMSLHQDTVSLDDPMWYTTYHAFMAITYLTVTYNLLRFIFHKAVTATALSAAHQPPSCELINFLLWMMTTPTHQGDFHLLTWYTITITWLWGVMVGLDEAQSRGDTTGFMVLVAWLILIWTLIIAFMIKGFSSISALTFMLFAFLGFGVFTALTVLTWKKAMLISTILEEGERAKHQTQTQTQAQFPSQSPNPGQSQTPGKGQRIISLVKTRPEKKIEPK